MKKAIVFIGLLFILVIESTFLSAQDNFKTPVVPPAPTSAVFSRYGNDQPSLQTGTVNIPISLFTVQAKGLDLPLTLTYQTSGITIMDNPYPAGYGWVFSPGFRITRTVMGRADERFPYMELTGGEDNQIIKKGILDEGLASQHQLNYSDLFDTQKDIFTLNMPSGSYNFFIKKNGSVYEAVTIGHQIKIEPLLTTGLISGFKVTDPGGVIFMFGFDQNTSFLDFTEPIGMAGYNAWMLREITLLNNEKINFSWQKVNTNAYAAKVNSPIVVTDRQPEACPGLGGVHVDEVGGIIEYASYSAANALMLKQISFPEGVIDLSYKSNQDPFLESMLVKNKRNQVIKTINLLYGSNVNNASNRLLQSLTINGATYNFQYNNNWFSELSTALDYWGYYNGKTTNTNLIPRMRLKVYTLFGGFGADWTSAYQEVGYANRAVSAEHMKAFMLTKITYPTGGFSEYEYEPHKFTPQSLNTDQIQSVDYISEGGGLRVSSVKNYSAVGTTPIIKSFKYGINEDGLANVASLPTLETFVSEYGIAQEVDGNVNVCPIVGGITWRTERQMHINGLSNYSKYTISKSPIWYSRVTEYINSDQKTEFNFTYLDYPASLETNYIGIKSPYVFRYENLYNSGPRPLSTIVYKNTGTSYTPLKEVLNEYETYQDPSLSTQNNLIIDRTSLYNHLNFPGPDYYPPGFYSGGLYPSTAYIGTIFPGEMDYKRLIYNISVKYDRVKKTTTTTYEGGQAVTTYEKFFYNDYCQLNKTTTGTSISDKELSMERKYPVDYSDAVYQQMVSKNIVLTPIEEITYQNAIVLKKNRYNFTSNPVITNGLILPLTLETSIGNAPYQAELNFEKYDDRGNQLQYTANNGITVSSVWGNGKQNVIARAVNAKFMDIFFDSFEDQTGWETFELAYDQTKSHAGRVAAKVTRTSGSPSVHHLNDWRQISLSQSTRFRYSGWVYSDGPSAAIYFLMKTASETGYTTDFHSTTTTQTGKWILLEGECDVAANMTQLNIRVQNNGGGTVWFDDIRFYPAAAQMTSYTYDPLIGMTSQADANNRFTYYEYDAFGRLGLVRDHDGNIIKKICYNYAGQPEACIVNTTPNWQPTGIYTCQKDANNINTGYRLREEMDLEVNSPTYGQARLVLDSYNTVACPLTSTTCIPTCRGNTRCINGVCEPGVKVYTGSGSDPSTGILSCIYHYEWSDGTWSSNMFEAYSSSCAFIGN